MTIGIGAVGPNAGAAVFAALRAAEQVGTGAIGGFAVFAAIDADGALHMAETQRGGTATLFTAGEATGTPPPPEIAAARYAAVISSGPDRTVPLRQFLAADPAVGLVTGHRLPNGMSDEGITYNAAVLRRLGAGMDAAAALAEVLGAEPEADAGMIALGPRCGIAALNSARVSRRYDLGSASRRGAEGAAVEVLHNAILPYRSLAPLVADIAMEAMVPSLPPLGEIIVEAGMPIVPGDSNRVMVDAQGRANRIETLDTRICTGRHNCAAIYLGTEVVRDGNVLGRTLAEPNVVVEEGHIVSLSGQSTVAIPYGANGGRPDDAA